MQKATAESLCKYVLKNIILFILKQGEWLHGRYISMYLLLSKQIQVQNNH